MAWGAVDNFHSRLQDIVSAYTGSAGGITGTDSGAVQQFLIDGCYDVLEKIKVLTQVLFGNFASVQLLIIITVKILTKTEIL